MPPPLPDIALELDARHHAARAAFEARDLVAYAAIFSPALTYRRADGRTIGRNALMNDVRRQMRTLSRLTSAYVRESLGGSAGAPVETLVQTSTVEAVAFGFLRRRWSVDRRGVYGWTKLNGEWVIASVEVVSEQIAHAGWRLGAEPPGPLVPG